ncbi:tetratricopeptide repeat protein [Candidatus Pacearchaeota archaeon]|nr:tetratricopeptide repeat protein [Candidatus Pacearchaeota archaeon]
MNVIETVEKGIEKHKQGDYSGAIELFLNALESFQEATHPQKTTLYFNLALAYWKLENFELAERYFKSSIENNKNFTMPYHELGKLYYDLKKYDKALEILNEGLQITLKDPSLNYYIAEVYFKLNKYKKAKNYAEICIDLFPNYKFKENAKKLLKECNRKIKKGWLSNLTNH